MSPVEQPTASVPRPARLAAQLLRSLEAALGAVAAAVLAVLLAVVLTAVVLRYAFGTGFIGSEDLGIWLHVALIAVGAPLALNSALAMRFDGVVFRLPAHGRAFAAIGADVFTVLAGLILIFGSARIAAMLGGISPTLGLPEWIRFGFFGVGGGLILLVLALQRVAEERGAALLAAAALGIVLFVAVGHASVSVPIPSSIVLGLIVVVGLIVAAPMPHAFLAAAYLAILFGSPLPEQAVVSTTVTSVSKFLLLAIPFFLLVGELLTASGTAARIVTFAASLVGHRRAGLAQTTLLTSVLFSGASGSSVANAAFGAAIFQPELVKRGYPPTQAAAIIAATSVLDNVIPPSIAFLILAVATNLSVGSLFVGGFIAGPLMALCLAVAIHLTMREATPMPRADAAERRRSAFAAIPALGLGVIVVVGIRLGVVTTTEAAALAALYTLFLGLGARLRFTSLYVAFRKAAVEAAAIGLLIGTAGPFAFLLATDNVSGVVSSMTMALGGSAIAVLLLSNLVLLAVGLVLDIGAAILLFGPILLPAAVAAGIDPIGFGVIIVVNLMIGGLTPPVGILVFVVSGVTRLPAGALFSAILPYLAALLVSLALLSAGTLLL
ncbi:TRAP transporter large permease subunit [Manganibacter manganicus]|uniref:ABC transporter permease n=1 Tax=Manganibacter manganicus TaxID=1873176 RepID=A0A1V8RS79_9HYPH|nr:TRAP transporter large permease subunit [Pseudaminobacter manganicus]OQM76037.1 ABC transporter permease [Pseudaminobacter manganicus]